MIALVRDVREFPDAYQPERARRLGVGEKGIGHALKARGSSSTGISYSESNWVKVSYVRSAVFRRQLIFFQSHASSQR